jgi:hypothetical protein
LFVKEEPEIVKAGTELDTAKFERALELASTKAPVPEKLTIELPPPPFAITAYPDWATFVPPLTACQVTSAFPTVEPTVSWFAEKATDILLMIVALGRITLNMPGLTFSIDVPDGAGAPLTSMDEIPQTLGVFVV